jgi:uncharacterized protein (DUF983 family)
MAECPSCHHQITPFFYSISPSVIFRNFFRSPARRIYECRNCGEEVVMTAGSFIAYNIGFVLTVVPSAILFARFYTFLTRSMEVFHRLSQTHPLLLMVCLWILPTLAVPILVLHLFVDRFFVVYKKADSA